MPFGAIYGALFFLALAVSMGLSAAAAGPSAATRACLALLAAALGWGLLRRCSWARWGGIALAALLVAGSLAGWLPGASATRLLVFFGALVSLLLFLIPTRGSLRSPGRPQTVDRLAAAAALVSAAGLVGALGYGLPLRQPSAAAAAAPRHALGSSPHWSDFDSGIERARAEGKPLLVNFVTDWCGYCRKMDSTTWKHPSVVERLDEMVAVRVDAEASRTLASRYGVTGYPTIMLLDDRGAVISRTGGYQQPRQFLEWLEAGLGRVVRSGAAPGA